jgi:O-antigen/teichoic acid export membrane protein
MRIGRSSSKGRSRNGLGRTVGERPAFAPVTAGRGALRAGESSERRVAVNALAGGAANLGKIGVQLVMLPVMARLLGPAEFGLYALALPAVSLFMVLADGGLAVSLAREPRDSTLVWSTAFWLIQPAGFVLAAIVTGLGYMLAAFAHEPRLPGLMALLSVSLILVAAEALPTASLTRQGRLVVVAAANLVSSVTGAAVAICLAMAGFGATSLAAQLVASYLVHAGILNVFAFVRPKFEFQLSSVLGHLSLGGALLGERLLDFSGRMLENVLYGRTFGAAALGAYTFANQAPRFICEAISSPIWAALFAHALHGDENQVRKAYANLARLTASLVFPAAALLSATASEILNAILGPKWDQAAAVLSILAPFYAMLVVAGVGGAVLVARNRGWLLFWMYTILAIGRVVAVGSGPWLGPIGVAVGIGATMVVFSLAMIVASARGDVSPFLLGLAPPGASSAIAGVVCYALAHVRAENASLVWIACCWTLAGAVYVSALAAIQPNTVRQVLEALRGLASGLRSRSGRGNDPRPIEPGNR